MLVTAVVGGRHGQEAIEAGHARQVLRLIGTALYQLQTLRPQTVPGLVGAGDVIVHGDFGPQNMHFDLSADAVCGIFDWESAHVGRRVEDLAWVEWIVRMHHPHAVCDLDELFAASRLEPAWVERHDAMLGQCREILAYCASSGMTEAAQDWRRLLAATEKWQS
jgi:aminoglycoside phosphotransferase (APT) family kinase protein